MDGERVNPGEIIIYPHGTSDEDLELLQLNLKHVGPTVITSERDAGGFYVHWIEPSWLSVALAILVGKGLLDGFLKEFGSDGAKALKATLKKIFHKRQDTQQKQITRIFPDGVPKTKKLLNVPLISITVYLGVSAVSSRFDFPPNLTDVESAAALESLPQAILFARNFASMHGRKRGQLEFVYHTGGWKQVRKQQSSKRSLKNLGTPKS